MTGRRRGGEQLLLLLLLLLEQALTVGEYLPAEVAQEEFFYDSSRRNVRESAQVGDIAWFWLESQQREAHTVTKTMRRK